MPETGYLAATVATAAVITFALRALPFAVMSRLRASSVVMYLGQHLPAGIMVILVLYLLRDVPTGPASAGVSTLVGVAATVAVQLWRRNMLLSIALGTVLYAGVLHVLT